MQTKLFSRCRFLSCVWASICLLGSGCTGTRSHLANHSGSMVTIPPQGLVPSELSKVSLPPYVIEAPDILLVEVYLPPQEGKNDPVLLYPQPISGQHLVRMDGSIGLGIYGSVPVAGLTVDQAKESIRQFVFNKIKDDPRIKKVLATLDSPDRLYVIVDVISYNSKTYYVFTDGAGYGEQVYEFPYQGNETVLSALARVGGIPTVGSKRNIWVARRTPHPNQPDQILPVDYVGTSQHGITLTNYQILPGDRVYVKAEKIFRVDSFLQKLLTPVERVLGITLLGSSTVNSIRNRQQGGGGNQGNN
jgi:polysaccharide biosynthesis/export protein